jgi:hypothetical protein
MLAPPFFNFATPLLHDAKNLCHFARRDTVIVRDLYPRLKPHFELTRGRIDMNMHPVFFEREEVERYGP